MPKLNQSHIPIIINLDNNGASRLDVCNHFKCSLETLRKFTKKHNLRLLNHKKIMPKNHEFFDKIDSEIKAYLLGYLVADGCIPIDKTKRCTGKIEERSIRIQFCISSVDIQVLHLYKEYISPEVSIKHFLNKKGAKNRKEQCSLRITSKYLTNTLKNTWNIWPRKTWHYDFVFPFHKINSIYIKDFIRGFFDGDGWCSNKQVGFCATSKLYLEQIALILQPVTGKLNNVTTSISKNKINVYTLTYGKKDSFEIYKWMYSNSNFYLERKKNKFIENTEVTESNSTVERSN